MVSRAFLVFFHDRLSSFDTIYGKLSPHYFRVFNFRAEKTERLDFMFENNEAPFSKKVFMNGLPSFDLNEILDGEHIVAYFQPIVSVKNNSIVGYEGLARGLHPETKGLIPPQELFAEAADKKLTLPLDRLCRKKVLEYFKTVHAFHPQRILSLNFEASVLD